MSLPGLAPTVWPAKTVLKLIFRRLLQMRPQIAVAAVSEHERALVVGTPELVGLGDMSDGRAFSPEASSLPARH